MTVEKLTAAQAAALEEIAEYGGRISHGMGVSAHTIRALERKGIVTVHWGKRREDLAPGGWTGRVYTSQSWWAQLTDAGSGT